MKLRNDRVIKIKDVIRFYEKVYDLVSLCEENGINNIGVVDVLK